MSINLVSNAHKTKKSHTPHPLGVEYNPHLFSIPTAIHIYITPSISFVSHTPSLSSKELLSSHPLPMCDKMHCPNIFDYRAMMRDSRIPPPPPPPAEMVPYAYVAYGSRGNCLKDTIMFKYNTIIVIHSFKTFL